MRLIFLSIFFLLNFLSFAGDTDSSDINRITIYTTSTPNIRPKDTSSLENHVECYIKGEYVYIEFEAYEGMVTTKLTNLETGEEQVSKASSLYPIQIYIGHQPASYELSISTSCNSYIGYFTIE